MSESFLFTFAFTLPPELRLEAPPGRHQPCIAGCVLTVDSGGEVAIEGCSREQVFAQARRFLRVIGFGYGPLEMAATLRIARRKTRVNALANAPAPERIVCEPGGCDDSWSIVIGADVVIAAAAIAPVVRGVEHGASQDVRA